ncbi:MAG: cupin domain-containing protein [Spirochaetales bacterium]|nr:cupin domain-containing protein [Spirochaetales bacterium]MBR6235376.1 cupin domain-containing protein [Spirochaetales bacterium]
MVRKSNEKHVEKAEHKFGADGYITVRHLINNDGELNDKGRVFAHTTVAPHSGIGYHVHNGDTEIYYVLSGKAEYNDNGTIVPIEAGDVTFTPSGTGHGINNPNDEPLDIIALIIYG